MKTIRIVFAFLLITGLLLSFAGCAPAQQQDTDHLNNSTVAYPWAKGESPISAERTGILRKFGIAAKNYEYTDTGVYFMDDYGFLMYADHGSDTFVLLCNRPDCLHADQPVEDWTNCNAYFWGNTLCYYDGYLYIFGSNVIQRCDLDGTDHETVFDLNELSGAYNGYSSWSLWNGYFTIFVKHIDAESGKDQVIGYYYKLDGTTEKPVQADPPLPYLNYMGAFIGETSNGDSVGYVMWDPETNITTYLTDDISTVIGSGHYGVEEALITQGSKVCRYVYADESVTTLFDTGLEGDLYMSCFPDCIVINQKLNDEYTLHFYNWAYESLGSTKLDYDMGKIEPYPVAHICAETHERIILAAGRRGIPKYYIEKSEFGTGKINIYEYNLPYLPE